MMSLSQLVTRIQRELFTTSVGQLIGFPRGKSSYKSSSEQDIRAKQKQMSSWWVGCEEPEKQGAERK